MKGQNVLFSHKSNEHGTPQWLYDKLNTIYHFTLDPCCDADNQKCDIGFGLDDEKLDYGEPLFSDHKHHYHANGLISSWTGYHVFVNPPYSKEKGNSESSGTSEWVTKAIQEVFYGDCPLVVMLLPSRTGMKWYTEGILPHYKELIFIQGRLRFEGSKDSAPFDSIIVIFEKNNHDHAIGVWSNKP